MPPRWRQTGMRKKQKAICLQESLNVNGQHCNIKNAQIDQWQQYAQRGGSRKIDSTKEYSHVYSEKWCLSINIEI